MEERTEKPIVFAVITLFLTFVVVYMVFFRQQNYDDIKPIVENISTGAMGSGYTGQQKFGSDLSGVLSNSLVTGSYITGSDQDGWVSLGADSDNASSSSSGTTSGLIYANNTTKPPTYSPKLIDKTQEFRQKLAVASGLSLWYNSIKMAETLALDTKFAFTDTGGILYGYLGTGSIEASNEIIKRLGGNSVEIETENDIMKNLLRGDRVVFINIPGVTFVRKGTTEQKLLVTIVIEIGEDKRLIQSPFDRYHPNKKRMKTIFEGLYDRIL